MNKSDPPRSKAHDEAETHFKRAPEKQSESAQAKADVEASTQAGRDKTEKLKSLRLAKDAADREAASTKSVPVSKLTDKKQHMTERRFRVLWGALGSPTKPGIYDWDGCPLHVTQVHIDAAEANPDAICYVTTSIPSSGPTMCSINSVEQPD